MRRRGKVAARVDTTAPVLISLAPKYSHSRHAVYYSVIKRAIDKQPEVRNIALAGTYGTGKSSILRKVSEAYGDRVVELSLLTLGSEPEPEPDPRGSNPAATTTTNRIQKEIVKQLLYQQRPNDAPESRFRRIVRFRWGAELRVAAGAGLAAAVMAFVSGLGAVSGPSPSFTFLPRPDWLASLVLYLAVALVGGGAMLGIRALLRGRVGIEKVSAGPATITLPPRSASYFDEYLDEIIYFFETNPTRDIVVIEDLDRFNDPNIFESLRSLNGLLNAARQLQNRNIRFIYAVRDSVFEKLGRDTSSEGSDEARAELVRANRTKFFELVIPVVPFITHKNARDLMHACLKERGHQISKDLIDLAARHLADMRLIYNIVNEYEIFKHRLLDVEEPVPELGPERLFAMVLFKNAHMADFEKIRHGESSLDTLWRTWRRIINKNLDELREDSKRTRTVIADREAATIHARNLADQLRKRIDALASAPGTALGGPSISFNGSEIDDETLQSPRFWKHFIESGQPLTINVWSRRATGVQAMQLSQETVETLLGSPIGSERFVANAIAAEEETLARNDESITFLRRHSWKELSENGRFKYADESDGVDRSFREWAEHLLPSRLAADLVIHGYISSHFSLHVSSFYGQLIRPDAMVYVMRCVDLNTFEPDYPLEPGDVEAILRDQGNTVLTERSMFNIGIFNHLLMSRSEDASVVVRNLLGSSDGSAFLDLYLESGSAKSQLIAQLSPIMPEIFTYLAAAAPLERKERVHLINAAIVHASTRRQRYAVSDELRELLEAEYRSLPVFASAADEKTSARAVQLLASAGAVIPDLTGLSDTAVLAFRGTRAYALTALNLEHILGTKDLSLDTIRRVDGEVFAYTTDSIKAYREAFIASESTRFTISEPDNFIDILNTSTTWSDMDFNDIVLSSHPDCGVTLLADVPIGSWPTIVRTLRVPLTFENVQAYVDGCGAVDANLAAALHDTDKITDCSMVDTDLRAQLALNIINAPVREFGVEQRIKLAASLDPGELDPGKLDPTAGPFIGALIEAQLIADNEDAFSARLMLDWATQASAMANSNNFVNFISPETLKPEYLAPLFDDEELRALHPAAASSLASYKQVPRNALVAAARSALKGAISVDAAFINMMRRGGVGTSITIELVAKANEQLSITEVQEILRALGGKWAKVANRGWGVHTIQDSQAATIVLTRLQEAKIVSKMPLEGSVRRVSLRKP